MVIKEDVLRKASLFKLIQDVAKIGTWSYEIQEDRAIWSEGTFEIFERAYQDTIRLEDTISSFTPESQSMLRYQVQKAIEKATSFDFEAQVFARKSKKTKWVRVLGFPVFEEEELVRLEGVIQDIDAQKKAQLRLKEQKENYERLINNIPGMVYQFHLDKDQNATFPFLSESSFDIYEISRRDYDKDPSLLMRKVVQDDEQSLYESIEQSKTSLQAFSWVGRIRTTSGEKWVSARSQPQQLPDGCYLWDGILLDISHEVQLQQELEEQRQINFHQTKLASIGRLASGVGHEINNPLTIIFSYLDSIGAKIREVEFPQKQKVFEMIEKSTIASQRIQNIVKGLRTFSRSDENQKSVFSLNALIKETYSLVHQIYSKENVSIDLSLPEKEVYVEGNYGRIQQSFLNLISNARDAALRNEKPKIDIQLHSIGPTLCCIEVRDNGRGIPMETQPHIFDPFFTTKEVNQGTGIGLALTQSIVHDHQGRIDFETWENQGTCFKIYLPQKAVSTLEPMTKPAKDTLYYDLRGNHFLIIDDEPEIIEIIQNILTEAGADTIGATGFEEVLSLVTEKPFDAILIDMKMPEMSGLDLARILREKLDAKCPPLLLCTGGTTLEERDGMTTEQLFDEIILKPFKKNDVLRTLKEVVSNKTPAKSLA